MVTESAMHYIEHIFAAIGVLTVLVGLTSFCSHHSRYRAMRRNGSGV